MRNNSSVFLNPWSILLRLGVRQGLQLTHVGLLVLHVPETGLQVRLAELVSSLEFKDVAETTDPGYDSGRRCST